MDPESVNVEHHFTVLVRLPFKRGEFVDPAPVSWSASKERELWDMISRPSRGNEINWRALSERFQVSQQFLLQQAAWLYERQLSQVRAQMRRVGSGSNPSNSPSPGPGMMSGSNIVPQGMRRTGSGGSRVPSRISNRQRDSPTPQDDGRGSSGKFRASPLPRPIVTQQRQDAGPSTRSKGSKESLSEPVTAKPSNSRGQNPHVVSPISPLQDSSSESSSSEDEPSTMSRRHVHRYRRSTQSRPTSYVQSTHSGDDEDGSESPPFLPFAAAQSSHSQDPGATLRGELRQRPTTPHRMISEKVPTDASPTPTSPSFGRRPSQALSTIESSAASSASSNDPVRSRSHGQKPQQQSTSRQPTSTTRGGPLSPRQAAALNAAGLSPRGRSSRVAAASGSREGGQNSDGTGTPSMGSSFSDLDDTSVTQSALEEALLSNMQRGGNGQGMASRMSTISQALRSKYL